MVYHRLASPGLREKSTRQGVRLVSFASFAFNLRGEADIGKGYIEGDKYMKLHSKIFFAAWISVVFAGSVCLAGDSQVKHLDHGKHKHGEKCGHVMEMIDGKATYYHDGHDHVVDAKHVKDIKMKIHAQHKHKHGKACGHKSKNKGNFVEYYHDGHWHHVHGGHVHESH